MRVIKALWIGDFGQNPVKRGVGLEVQILNELDESVVTWGVGESRPPSPHAKSKRVRKLLKQKGCQFGKRKRVNASSGPNQAGVNEWCVPPRLRSEQAMVSKRTENAQRR